jgi:hypothetical protein
MIGVGRRGVCVCRTSQIDWISCASQGRSCTEGCPGFAGLLDSFSKVSYLVNVDVLESQTPDVRNGILASAPRGMSSGALSWDLRRIAAAREPLTVM